MDTNKKVIHIITRLVRGGADENTTISCLGLQERGWVVILVVGKEHSYDLHALKDRGIRVLVMEDLVRSISPIKDFKAIIAFGRMCKQYKPDIVHTHTAKAGFVGRVGATLAKTPYIIHSIHGSPLDSVKNPYKKKILSFAERWTSNFNDYYISVGKEIFEKYCRQMGIRPKNYKIVRSAFDTDYFAHASLYREEQREKLGLVNSDIAIGMIGRVAPQKGYEYYAKLCRKLSDTPRQFKFFSMGKIDDRQYYQKVKSQFMHAADYMNFIGEVEYKELPKYIAAMDIIVHTALWEGLPRSVVESLIAGKPVITFAVDGVREVIDQGKNGYIVAMGDVENMRDTLLHLVEEIGLESFQTRAREVNERLREEFKVGHMIDGIEESYFKAI